MIEEKDLNLIKFELDIFFNILEVDCGYTNEDMIPELQNRLDTAVTHISQFREKLKIGGK